MELTVRPRWGHDPTLQVHRTNRKLLCLFSANGERLLSDVQVPGSIPLTTNFFPVILFYFRDNHLCGFSIAWSRVRTLDKRSSQISPPQGELCWPCYLLRSVSSAHVTSVHDDTWLKAQGSRVSRHRTPIAGWTQINFAKAAILRFVPRLSGAKVIALRPDQIGAGEVNWRLHCTSSCTSASACVHLSVSVRSFLVGLSPVHCVCTDLRTSSAWSTATGHPTNRIDCYILKLIYSGCQQASFVIN